MVAAMSSSCFERASKYAKRSLTFVDTLKYSSFYLKDLIPEMKLMIGDESPVNVCTKKFTKRYIT